MNEYYSVFLPVKPYILKFVQSKETCPLKLDGEGLFAILIWEHIENTCDACHRPDRRKYGALDKTDNLELLVPTRYQGKVGKVIHQFAVQYLNQFLEDYFNYSLLRYIEKNNLPDCRYPGYKDTYFKFAENYNIEMEIDITYESMRKKETHLRKQITTGNKAEINAEYYGKFFSRIVPRYEKGLPIVLFGFK